MTLIDFAFVASFTMVIGLSKVFRVMLWETFRHPFSVSVIRMKDGEIQVARTKAARM